MKRANRSGTGWRIAAAPTGVGRDARLRVEDPGGPGSTATRRTPAVNRAPHREA